MPDASVPENRGPRGLRREYEGPIYEALWDFGDEKHIRDDAYSSDLVHDAGDVLVELVQAIDRLVKYELKQGGIESHPEEDLVALLTDINAHELAAAVEAAQKAKGGSA